MTALPAGEDASRPSELRILEDEVVGRVRHRGFRISGASGEIPGALWTPPDAAVGDDLPLVLIGHGASGHKYQDYVRRLGRRLAGEHAMAAAAIDGPVHGSRRRDGGGDGRRAFLDFAALWSSSPSLTDAMVDDWQRTLRALSSLEETGGPVGYWGVSMGTILGLPFVAAEAKVEAAVFGLMGMTGPTRERIAEDAPKVRCPVLFLVQWSDELFSRESAFHLFEALGSSDKSLHANPGPHGAVPRREYAATIDFLVAHLSRT